MKALYNQARDATMDTPITTLRRLEKRLIADDSDNADMCLPHIESLILAKLTSELFAHTLGGMGRAS